MGGSGGTQKQSQALEQQQVALGQQQNALGQQFLQQGQQEIQRSNTLQQPLVDFYTGIASGSQANRISAAAPLLGQISQGTKQAEENIYNTVPAGAGRDVALAQANIQQGQSSAGAMNQAYTGALQNLGQLAAGQATLGLQQEGAGFTGTGQALTGFNQGQGALQNIMTAQNQQKASTLGFFGSLAGAAGTAAGGGAFGSLGCWIAEAIYGTDDIRTHLVRAWLNGPFKQTLTGRLVMRFYIRFGERIAAIVPRSRILRFILTLLFNAVLRRASRCELRVV